MGEKSVRVGAKRPLYLLLLAGLAIGCTAGQSLGVPVDESRTPTKEAPTSEPLALPPTTTVPSANLSEATHGMPGEEWEEIEEGIRSGVVKILIERGMSPEMAETEADRMMTEGVEVDVVEEQFEIFEDWMRNYPNHPVLGSHWTNDDAKCVIFTMLKREGIRETGKLIAKASQGGMSELDAESLVQPVADCVTLKEMIQAEMHQDQAASVEDVECVMGDVTEEQIVSWFVADFTDGAAAMRDAFLRDVDWSCWPVGKPAT
jgi:hypothetical protein